MILKMGLQSACPEAARSPHIVQQWSGVDEIGVKLIKGRDSQHFHANLQLFCENYENGQQS